MDLAPSSGSSRLARWRNRPTAKLVFVGIVGVILVGVAWFGGPRGFTPRPASIASTLQAAPVAVAPGVYLLGRTSPAAVYVVETSKGLVLIDSGKEPDAAVVISQLAELHLEVKQLQAILLTHVHADHSLGAAHLRSLTGAKIYAGRDDSETLREGGPREAFVSTFHMPSTTPHSTAVDVELAGAETIQFAETKFTALTAPGHTPGSICFLLERPGLRALFAGDVILSLNGAEPLGTYPAYLPPRFRGSARDYLATLERLSSMPVPDLVLPGHPRMDQVPQSPRLSQERWHDMLRAGIAEIQKLLARHETDGADFLDGTPKELLPGLHYLGNIGIRAVYCLDGPKGLFLFNAPGQDEFVGFLASRFRELGWEGRKPTAVLLTSADEESISGLPSLVQKTGCLLFAPKAAREEIRRLLPATAQILSEDDVGSRSGLEGKAIVLGGRGQDLLAYLFRWKNRTVLVSDRIPVKPSVPTAQELLRDINGPGGSAAQYIRSLDQLRQLAPNLWLPAVPVHGQNANLYDQEWERLLAQNWQIIR